MSARTPLRLVLWFLLAACGAAAPHVLPPAPGRGGPVWHELGSEHFTLWTDLSVDEARKTLQHLEDFRRAMVELIFSAAPNGESPAAPSRSLVIAFRHWDDWTLFGDPQVVGFFVPADRSPFHRPFLAYVAEEHHESGYRRLGDTVYYWETGADPRTTVQHELGHLIMDTLVGEPPGWLDEGVASYFETARFDERARQAEIGRLPDNLDDEIRASGLAHVVEIVAPNARASHSRSFYLSSQLLVSFLLNHEPERFATYQRVLKQVPAEQRGEVWQVVFADYPAARLEGDMAAWLRKGKLTLLKVRLPPRSAAPHLRTLTDADVYAVRALMYAQLGAGHKRAEEIDAARAAVAADASHLLGSFMLVALDLTAEIHAHDVVAAHPDDSLAWALLAVTLAAGDEQDEAMRKACDLARNDPAGSLVARLCDR